MNPTVEIRPAKGTDGFTLTYGTLELWYGMEIHAINYAQDLCSQCDILVYHPNGTLKHRYTAMRPQTGKVNVDKDPGD